MTCMASDACTRVMYFSTYFIVATIGLIVLAAQLHSLPECFSSTEAPMQACMESHGHDPAE